MTDALAAAGEQVGRQAVAAAIERGAARIAAALPDITVDATADGVVLSGRGLSRRWVADVRLRWIGSYFE